MSELYKVVIKQLEAPKDCPRETREVAAAILKDTEADGASVKEAMVAMAKTMGLWAAKFMGPETPKFEQARPPEPPPAERKT